MNLIYVSIDQFVEDDDDDDDEKITTNYINEEKIRFPPTRM